ncbi:MAG: response regulator transcription factor [Anaerolineae bacterium]
MGSNHTARILVADNDARVRLALQTLLGQEPGRIEVRESADLGSLAVQVRQFRPDLVLLDWELPGRPAAALLLALHQLDYHPNVIVLSTRPELEQDALDIGADGFVSKGDSPEQLLQVLHKLVYDSKTRHSAEKGEMA